MSFAHESVPTPGAGGSVSKRKPWRTVVQTEETGRFTHEQLDAAVLAVMARRHAPPGRPMVARERGPEYGTRAPDGQAPTAGGMES
jgi:hypothetical protein